MKFARLAAILVATLVAGASAAQAQQPQPAPNTYSSDELVSAGHKFFGSVSRGLASVVERAVSRWGLPNGYVLGEEGSGAIVVGFNVRPDPSARREADNGGIVLSAVASDTGTDRLAHVLVVDANSVNAPNAGASATNSMPLIVGKLAGEVCDALRVSPGQTVWVEVDSDGHFDYVLPQWPGVIGAKAPIPVSWGPVLYPPLPSRSARAYYEPRGADARRLLTHVQGVLGAEGPLESFGEIKREAAMKEARAC